MAGMKQEGESVASQYPLRNPVYLVGKRAYSIVDLLKRFTEEEYKDKGGISRLSDLHLKVGEPARDTIHSLGQAGLVVAGRRPVLTTDRDRAARDLLSCEYDRIRTRKAAAADDHRGRAAGRAMSMPSSGPV